MESEERFLAVRLLIEVLHRTLNPAEHADVESWIDLRNEDEGGFLWLANAMGIPPRWLDNGLRMILDATPAERSQLRKRLLAFNNAILELQA